MHTDAVVCENKRKTDKNEQNHKVKLLWPMNYAFYVPKHSDKRYESREKREKERKKNILRHVSIVLKP